MRRPGRVVLGPNDPGSLPIGDVGDFVPRDSPVHVVFDHEMAGASEMIDQTEIMLKPELADHEVFRRAFRQALMASHRAGPGA